jgi:hypothetical protein
MANGPNAVPIETCTLWAPACTMAVYQNQYLPSIHSGAIRKFTLFTLTDKAERDDSCANIYHKSLLYLVSNAFESAHQKAPFLRERNGEPLLGMAKFVSKLPEAQRTWDWVQAPNANPNSSLEASAAKAHGAFDDDPATLASTLGTDCRSGQGQPRGIRASSVGGRESCDSGATECNVDRLVVRSGRSA